MTMNRNGLGSRALSRQELEDAVAQKNRELIGIKDNAETLNEMGKGTVARYKPDQPSHYAEPVKIASSYASTGFIGIDEANYRARRQRYFSRRRALEDLFTIAYNVAEVRTSILNLANEVFRRGVEFRPIYHRVCTNPDCGEEYNQQKATCDICGHPTRSPRRASLKRIKSMMERANPFGQTLMTVLRQVEDDINVIDDAFIMMATTYEFDKFGIVNAKRVDYIQRVDPLFIEIELDERGYPARKTWICLKHRDVSTSTVENAGPHVDVMQEQVGAPAPVLGGGCSYKDDSSSSGKCGVQLVPAFFKYQWRGVTKYYTEEEIIHISRYTPSETYGFSPIFAFYEKALTLIGMDRYLYDYFFDRQLPVGILSVVSDNLEAIEERKSEWQAELQNNPHYIPMLGIESETGAGKMEWLKLGYTLQEMDYLPIRDELRQRIQGLYGMTSMFVGAPDDVAGQSSSTQQLVVQSRTTSRAQQIYNEIVFPKLLKAFDVQDFEMVLLNPEEQSEELEIDLDIKRAQYAQTMVNMGFTAILLPNGDWIFEGKGSRDSDINLGDATDVAGASGNAFTPRDQATETPPEPTPLPQLEMPDMPPIGGPAARQPIGVRSSIHAGYSELLGRYILNEDRRTRSQPYSSHRLAKQLESQLWKYCNDEILKGFSPGMTKEAINSTLVGNVQNFLQMAVDSAQPVLFELAVTGIEEGIRDGGGQPDDATIKASIDVLNGYEFGFTPALNKWALNKREEILEAIALSKTGEGDTIFASRLQNALEKGRSDLHGSIRKVAVDLGNEGRLLAWSLDNSKDNYDYLLTKDDETSGRLDYDAICNEWRTGNRTLKWAVARVGKSA